jgi:hypothetical protein
VRLLVYFLCFTSGYCLLLGNSNNVSFSEGDKLFALKIGPLLEEKCLSCHSDKQGKVKGDLDLSSLDGMLFGGETSENVLVPHKPEKSLLFTAISWNDSDYEMPPKENDRLTPKQIEWFSNGLNLVHPGLGSPFRKKLNQLKERKS